MFVLQGAAGEKGDRGEIGPAGPMVRQHFPPKINIIIRHRGDALVWCSAMIPNITK